MKLDGGIDEIPLPATASGRLWLCGKHAIGPDPEGLMARVGADGVVCLNAGARARRAVSELCELVACPTGGAGAVVADPRPACADRWRSSNRVLTEIVDRLWWATG